MNLKDELINYNQFGKKTFYTKTHCITHEASIDTFVNEFWTARQRDSHSLHEIPYHACFKAQLPNFFIQRMTNVGDIVYDPFMGRGTTLIESALLGRIPYGNDVNPLSSILIEPRLNPPEYSEIEQTLDRINLSYDEELPQELFVFYHPNTLKELLALKKYFSSHMLSNVDSWIRMVSLSRLTGHSNGFFSVYTLPPNQSVSIESQQKINEKLNQVPEYRSVKERILKKSKALLMNCNEIKPCFNGAYKLLSKEANNTIEIPNDCISLIVTSPPFFDLINYKQDNWLKNWFADIDSSNIPFVMEKSIDGWSNYMNTVFKELYRVLKPDGYLAFEVGELNKRDIQMEDLIIPIGIENNLKVELILINFQSFTKTSNCWGVNNNQKGVNTNRIILFRK